MSGDGTVSLEELIYGVGRLKGPARSLDVESRQQRSQERMGLLWWKRHTSSTYSLMNFKTSEGLHDESKQIVVNSMHATKDLNMR